MDDIELHLPTLSRHPSVVRAIADKKRAEDDASVFTLTDDLRRLPPRDRGYKAWMYVLSTFLLEAVIWSIPGAYGVFLEYYTTVLFPGQENFKLLPLIGTLSSGIMYMSGAILTPILGRYPAWRNEVVLTGLLCCIGAFVGAGFSTRPIHLVLTQGILYSVGGAALYFPAICILNEWFDERIGLASGIINSGMGIGGVAMPFIIRHLLHTYGSQVTFLVLGLLVMALSLPITMYSKPRTPVVQATRLTWKDAVFLTRPTFWLFSVASFLQAVGFFLPGIYLPLFADHLALGTTAGTLAVALMNALSIPGIIIVCAISDRYDLRIAICITSIGSGLCVFLIWGFTDRLVSLLVFACAYGFLSAPYSAMWPKYINVILHKEPHLYGTVVSFVAISRGLGNVLAAPISTAIMSGASLPTEPGLGYHLSGFGPLIYFTGATTFASSVAAFYPLLARRREGLPEEPPIEIRVELEHDGSGDEKADEK